MIARSDEDITNLRKAGHILATVLKELSAMTRVGVSTAELDLAAEKSIRAAGAVPAFLGYKPQGASYPYPATLCVSINDEVVHGIPSTERVLQTGDLVKLDLGLSYEGYFVDSATTVCVGECTQEEQRLLEATKEATRDAIAAAKVGGRVGDIGAAVERVAKKYNFEIVQDLGGHAVGKSVHEKPFIPNEGREGEGELLKEGLVLAIEPMFALGGGDIELEADDWTYRTRDGKRSSHFEHTVILTKNGPEILTA